jgi:hypothetical protein
LAHASFAGRSWHITRALQLWFRCSAKAQIYLRLSERHAEKIDVKLSFLLRPAVTAQTLLGGAFPAFSHSLVLR